MCSFSTTKTLIMPTKNEMKQLFDETRAERDSLKSELARAAQKKDKLAVFERNGSRTSRCLQEAEYRSSRDRKSGGSC